MSFDLLTREVPDTAAGLGLVTMALIVFVWGAALVVDAYDVAGKRWKPRWHHERWWPNSFGLWLGLFLIVSDAGVYGLLGWAVLFSPRGIDAWGFGYVLFCTAVAVVAFAHWARDRRRDARRRRATGG